MPFRIAAFRPAFRLVTPLRPLSTSAPLRAAAGYGDPQDERIKNETPTPATTPDPKPAGSKSGPKTKSGTTDPEVKPKKSTKKSEPKEAKETKTKAKSTGNAGGDKGERTNENPSEKDVVETKKVGESPKLEEVGGSGPIGG